MNERRGGDDRDAEAREEMLFHVEMFVQREMARGVDEAEARRRARLELGDVLPVAEAMAEARPGAFREALARETRHATRALRRSPGFTAVAVLLVALGVGASTTIFTLVERILLRPLPYPQSERLHRIFETSPERGIDRTGVARGNLAAWRREGGPFEGLAAAYVMGRTLTVEDRSEVALTAHVTCDFFPLVGVPAEVGRTFTEDECRRAQYNGAMGLAGPDPVALLSHGLWQRRFAADPAVVGRTVTIERREVRVVGVTPSGFALPEAGVEVFLPWELEKSLPRDQRYTTALGRLSPGVAATEAQAHLDGVARRLAAETPETNRGWGTLVVPLQEDATAGARPLLTALFAAVGLVLLVACANVALLFLARGAARAQEVALRLALGAGRARVLRQGLLEAGLVAGLGGFLGAGLAAAALAAIPGLWPDLPRVGELRVDLPALSFALFASLLAALLAGGLPAWRAARLDPRAAFLDGPRVTEDRSARHSRNVLVVAEVALTLVLLAGAGLLVRSVAELRGADPGFDARGVVVAPVFLDGEAYGSGEKSRAYYARLFERLRAIPGVGGVGGATTLPASPRGPGFDRPVWPAGAEGDERRVRHAAVRMVTPGYFDTLRIPVVAGRAFDERDAPNAPPVLAVSQTLARALWPAGDAVGRSLVVDYSTNGTYPYEVVAVVGDVRFQGPRSEPKAETYLPHAQRPYLILNVAVRVEDAAAAGAAAAVRQALHETDPRIPPHGVHSLTELLGATFARERLARGLFLGFATIACLLSALGLYGMLAYRVQQRTAEIGVRLALGASPARIVREVAREGARLVGWGATLGAAAAALGLPLLRSLLYGVSPADPVAAAGALAVLALVSGLAVLRPAWLASRLDPARTLRRG